MNMFTQRQQAGLLFLALFGLLIPNGIFLYYAFTDFSVVWEALGNPVSAVFIAEAMGLMIFFAWLLNRLNFRRPGAWGFIIMSLLGSMAFSIPAFLWWHNRASRHKTG
ncbi:MAG TPA: hypothetical protein PJ991_13205 [Kiritimatiellia bacterium]|nr:hypothetical protein [Kiritimatiellia bacterium]